KPRTAKGDGTFIGHEEVGAEMARGALERLRFSQREVEVVTNLVRLHLRPVFYRSEWTDGAVRRLARDAGPNLDRLMALAGAHTANGGSGPLGPEPKATVRVKEDMLSGRYALRGPGQAPGSFSGQIECDGDLLIGPDAHVEADIRRHRITVSGLVRGNVIAS